MDGRTVSSRASNQFHSAANPRQSCSSWCPERERERERCGAGRRCRQQTDCRLQFTDLIMFTAVSSARTSAVLSIIRKERRGCDVMRGWKVTDIQRCTNASIVQVYTLIMTMIMMMIMMIMIIFFGFGSKDPEG